MTSENYIYVYHSKSNIHGIGVFVNDDIKKGQIIGVSQVLYKGVWYMTTHGNYNHSVNPNCIVESRLEDNINLIIADRDIKKGEELTTDYTKQPYLEQPGKDWV